MANVNLQEPLIFGGVTEIVLTPYNVAGTELGSDDYILDNIVADSTTITQEENTNNPIEAETKDEPLYENITLGSYTFASNSGDIQPAILTGVFGFTKGTDTSADVFYAPTTYKPVWVKVQVKFGDTGTLVCPKVKLSCRINASSLKTGIVQGEITGTCYAGKVGTGSELSPFYITVPKSAPNPGI